ncbi:MULTISPECIES: DEAD/DEAH box helicase [unclassified Bradyrhizobium]|uniref:DEAD/DEAH box helicase n=1 Tax=unclassified Bradyrhizobium TaxID=2631580 RepID=UPI001CD70595|nr:MULTISPECIES: DEAD/DEAH box helicase [unclassified Bradyrhizobium]MCA1374333.1 DEAD/DEAH box helicase [Bradyrhizobium sp. IC4060]MCA1484695.1 DEAD/DEAH box helicase [Bradyrhizobium sp. IC4061]
MSAKLISTCEDEHVAVRLVQPRTLGIGAPKELGQDAWASLGDHLQPIARRLVALARDKIATWDGNRLLIPNETAAEFTSSFGGAIGLPGPAPVMVDVSFTGTLSSNPSVRLVWKDTSYLIIDPQRTGILLQWGGRSGVLQGALLQLVVAAEAFNAVAQRPIEQRVEKWAAVTAALARVDPATVEADEFTKSFTVFQAGSFSLDVRDAPGSLDFVPVLMSRSKARSLDDNAPALDTDGEADQNPFDELVDEEANRLLAATDQSAFQRAFEGEHEVSRAYRVRRTTYVLIDPDLRSALKVVKSARAAPDAEKREFVRNPRAAIAKGLGLGASDGLTSALFVETRQYSDRVTGLGLWERPELSWLSNSSTQWLPERFPVRLGDSDIEITRKEVEELHEECRRADEEKRDKVAFKGTEIRVEQAREILGQVVGSAVVEPALATSPDAENRYGVDESERLAPKGPFVVQIKTNFKDVSYEATLVPRRAGVATTPPAERLGRNAFKPHQSEGFEWLIRSWLAGWRGVLLADDMGLGKSFQSLAFLAWIRKNSEALARKKGSRSLPILVVAPTALLQNWIKEARLHLAPDALGPNRADVFGSGIRKFMNTEPATADIEPLDWRKIADHDWVLTTYETLADNHVAFGKIRFSVAVFDEIQKIKEPGTLNTWASKAMDADFVLGLSGTPIENRIEDLWSIMDRVSPGLLGDLQRFSKTYRDADINRYRTLSDLLLKPNANTPPIILRRMKEDVKVSLPSKTVVPYPVEMPALQAKHYDDVIEKALAPGERKRGAILETVQRLRGISLFPGEPSKFDLTKRVECLAWIGQSARLGKTFEILRNVQRRGERALVFVEHRAMQSMLAEAIATEMGIPRPIIINGGTPGAKRQAFVDDFEEGREAFDVMILSPKAAGVGLTILSANHVVHLSRWWNPAVEDQCNDRVYRIGQTKPVSIHVPLARHPKWGDKSFDMSLDRLLAKKREMSKGLLAPPVSDADLDEVFDDIRQPA